MSLPLIATKLYMPRPRPNAVHRRRLTELLNERANRKLTLIAAPAGYGKTTAVGAWLAGCGRPAAWLTVDAGDNEFIRFLSYAIAALRTVDESLGSQALTLLQSPQPAHPEAILSTLIHELANVPEPFALVLDDYHEIRSSAVHEAISFLLEHMPPRLQLVLLTREEPELPLARLRVRGEVADLGVDELRFRPEETNAFFVDAMGLELTAEAASEIERRSEGWIAGLQLIAVSMQGQASPVPSFLARCAAQSVLVDYFVEEVLRKQSAAMRAFLLATSILDRLSASLCDAILLDEAAAPSDEALYALERANLFLVPLDGEGRWYRYHRLFAEALRRKLTALPSAPDRPNVDELHARASGWFERHGLHAEAFRHAAASNRPELAAALAEGDGMPLHLRGEHAAVLKWLETLSDAALDARPSLWVVYGSALLLAGRPTEVEAKLEAAERAMRGRPETDALRNWIGLIAATRAAIGAVAFAGASPIPELKLRAAEAALRGTEEAATRGAGEDDMTQRIVGRIVSAQSSGAPAPETLDAVIEQARRAMAYLRADLVPVRMTMGWLIGFASRLRGDRVAAREAYTEVLATSRGMGGNVIGAMATVGLAGLFEAEGRLHEADECYRGALQAMGELPLQAASEAYMGLARISYARNDLDQAKRDAAMSIASARQARSSDAVATGELFLAVAALESGDCDEASARLGEAERSVRTHRLGHRTAEIDAVRARIADRLAAKRRRERAVAPSVEPLTERELEVLRLIAQGLSNREIGAALFLALDSVKGHNRRIFEKLQVKRRTEAIALARTFGWIE